MSCLQYAKIGVLLQFESLLSTRGKEYGMLEDFFAAVQMLTNVKFIVRSETDLKVTSCTV